MCDIKNYSSQIWPNSTLRLLYLKSFKAFVNLWVTREEFLKSINGGILILDRKFTIKKCLLSWLKTNKLVYFRDIYKAMVLDMDDAVTDIVASLKKNNLYNDTIIVFTTDNGGAISHGASNWPLRGTKGTMFEGGTRAVR